MIVSHFLRLPEVRTATGLSRSTIYRLITDGQFPKPIKLAARSVAWCAAEIEAWMAGKLAMRGA